MYYFNPAHWSLPIEVVLLLVKNKHRGYAAFLRASRSKTRTENADQELLEGEEIVVEREVQVHASVADPHVDWEPSLFYRQRSLGALGYGAARLSTRDISFLVVAWL